MKWMDRVWALLVLAAAAVLGALLCGHIIGAKQAQTALLLVATTALLVLAGTLVWIGKQLQDILRRLKEQEYTPAPSAAEEYPAAVFRSIPASRPAPAAPLLPPRAALSVPALHR